MTRILLVIVVLVLAACQAAPTKVSEVQIREYDVLMDKAQRSLVLTESTVVLDTRSSFDYGLNRVENSLHMPWQTLAESEKSGELLRDQRKAALRLSLNGLQPSTPIVVVGYGLKGVGEEGRLAWNLLELGFHDVQVASVDVFRKNWTQNASPPAKNVPLWNVEARPQLEIGKEEFAKLAADPKGRVENKIWIIDVRSHKEYFNKTGTKAPDINALNMEWKEFYTTEGRPNPRVREKLQALNIQPGDRVILISNKGVRSAAAAYALIALGYKSVQNFTGGWNSLRYQVPF